MNVEWNQLSPTMQGVLIAVCAISFVLWLIALVWWYRTPAERMTLPKVAWLLVILFANGIGPIAWFVAGRKPAPVDIPPVVHDWANDQQRAVDALYGRKQGQR